MNSNRYGQQLAELEKKVLEELPAMKDFSELRAVLSHWLLNPTGNIPLAEELGLAFIRSQLHSLPTSLPERMSVFEESEDYGIDEIQPLLNLDFSDIPYPPPSECSFTFIDLFAGVGGFRQAMQSVSGKCVFTSEWDKYAQQTYFANYGEVPYGDIRKINADSIPDHDVLCAGFPCQPFSLAGVSKKNSMGRKHGFEDETQGTLFFDIARILKAKRPKSFFLENVKNLQRHDKGQTFNTIFRTLTEELGYVVNFKVVDGGKWVPQHRERIFIVGFDPKVFPNITEEDIRIPSEPSDSYNYTELSTIIKDEVPDKYTLGPGTWDTLVRHKAHHAKAGNGFGYGLHEVPIKQGAVTRTISARYHKDGAEILIDQPSKPRPRRLTIEEAMQLQGYDPNRFVFPVSDTQAYKQIGNSVVVPAIKAVAEEISMLLKRT